MVRVTEVDHMLICAQDMGMRGEDGIYLHGPITQTL
jgi:hypothetical protein